ncbi:MAG: arsenate reductase (glutaredoxin) [Paracoccaceae bacterium]
MDGITIWHNPRCGTSREVLAMIRAAGAEPQVVDYLHTPPTRADLLAVLARAGLCVRDLLRRKEPLAAELGLTGAGAEEGRIVEAMLAHPVLIERPVVITPDGVALCRPAERVLGLLNRG